ncbi:MAG: hypothetical protein QOI31_2746 [Solirubrobacterales bacterium]|jgi:hypothetical protein|nr:hypothetical protein [Solirubrobacterales bacterium]
MPDQDAGERVRELVGFALEKLPSMRLDDGSFCYEVAAPGLVPSGSSLRYTLICLLGLQRAKTAGLEVPIEPNELRDLVMDRIDGPEMTAGDLALLMWADSRAGMSAMDAIAFRLHKKLGADLPDLEGLELSWLVIGAAEAGAYELCDRALERQLERASAPSRLFTHRDSGRRARFPNFATQIYGVLALAVAARSGHLTDRALATARRVAGCLLELQRPDGGWPWIFDAKRGTVVEPYEVYSVHQDAMAPMALLELSEVTGEPEYRDAAIRGLDWIFGQNDLNREMLDHEAGILYRSIRRRPGFDRALLYANTATSSVGRAALSGLRGPLELNPTDRPYHLGWILEAWAGREPATSS